MHAKDTPESKANMLTQFPWIASEVFLAVCCQANSMILSLLLLIPVSFPPLFSLFPSFPRPPWPNGTAKSPRLLCRGAALFTYPLNLPKQTHHQHASGGAEPEPRESPRRRADIKEGVYLKGKVHTVWRRSGMRRAERRRESLDTKCHKHLLLGDATRSST